MDTSISLLDRLENAADHAAWQGFYGLYQPWLERWIRQLEPGISVTDRDDVMQEVMKVFCQKIASFRRERAGSLRSWLRNLVVYRLMEYRRRRGQQLPALEGGGGSRLDEIAQPESLLAQQWDQEHDLYILRQLIALLRTEFSSDRIEVFRRIVLEGESADSVARALKKTKNAVLLDKSRVLRRLREEARGLIE